MSKRGQSTGLPKAGGKNAPPSAATPKGKAQPRLLREYRSKAEREAILQRYILLGTGVVIAIAAVILVIAIVVDQFVTPGQTVATVNGTQITVGEFQRRVRLERALRNNQLNQVIGLYQSFGLSNEQIAQQISSQEPYASWLNELQVPDQLGNRVLNLMIEDELVRQKAAELGITVTDADIDQEIFDFFGYDPNAALTTPTPTPEPSNTPTPFVSPTPSPTRTPTLTPEFTPTPSVTPAPSSTPEPTPNATQRAETFNSDRSSFFAEIRSAAGVSDAEIRAFFEMRALRKALRDAVTAEMSRTAPFVNARHILVATEQEALDILAALEAGDSFFDLARALSTDTSTKDSGGELDWAPASNYVTPFADAVREAEIGAFIGPVQTEFGYHVIQVRAREDRELSDDEFETAKDNEFETYLDELRSAETTSVQTFSIWVDNVPEDPRFVPRF